MSAATLPGTEQPVLIAAAGHGRRFGGPKVFARADGTTFLERILARCREAGAPVTLVVDPAFRERVATALPGDLAVRLVEADGTHPMLASVQAGLAAGGFERGFWMWPVDAPFLSPVGWTRAVRAVAGAPEHVWKLRSEGRGGHPTWFPGWAVPLIRTGDWPDGLQGFFRDHEAAIRLLHLDGETLRDVDTPEDLHAVTGTGGRGSD